MELSWKTARVFRMSDQRRVDPKKGKGFTKGSQETFTGVFKPGVNALRSGPDNGGELPMPVFPEPTCDG